MARTAVKITGAFDTRQNRQAVYAFLTDPRRLATAFPHTGAETSDDAFTIHADVRLGPLVGSIAVQMRIVKRVEGARAVYRGRGTGLGSTLDLGAAFQLTDREHGQGTRVTWWGEVNISGPLGPIAGDALRPIAERNVGDLMRSVERSLE